jgi:deazaflavin-dependent oxidoreductase (nitroreductase family)
LISSTAFRERARCSLIYTLGRVHRTVVRASGGRVLGRVVGMPVLLLTTTGRRTGKQRTIPLTYLRDGGDLAVVGSFGGSDRAPAWWLNLEHDPCAKVQLGGVTIAVSARTASPEERARLWPTFIGTYRGYARYQARTRRQLPIVLLTPIDHDSPVRQPSGPVVNRRLRRRPPP